jgi:hypothetical protein
MNSLAESDGLFQSRSRFPQIFRGDINFTRRHESDAEEEIINT